MVWWIWCCHNDHTLLESSSWYAFTTEHWRKLPNFTTFLEIFLYLKNNNSVEHVQNVLLIVLFIIFKVKQSFHTAYGGSVCFEFLFWFSSAVLLSKMKSLFISLWKFAKFLMSFLKVQVSFPSNFASIFSAIKHNSSVLL